MLASWKGQVVAKAWPKPRGKPKSHLQLAWVNRFSQLACLSARADAGARDYADSVSKGTLWFWRDVVVKAALGQFLIQQGEVRMATPTVSVQRLAAVNILTSSDTIITPDTENWDTNNFWNPTSPTSYLTARGAGLYLIGANLQWAVQSAGQRTLRIQINGTTYDEVSQPGQATTAVFQSILVLAYLHAADQIRVSVRQNSTATVAATLKHLFAVGITPEAIT